MPSEKSHNLNAIWFLTLFGDLTLRREDAGGAGAVGDAEPIRRFRSQKAAALLAYLAYHRGRAVSREFLCELLWPEEADADVTRNRLRVTLASLRRQLEPPGVPAGAVLENVGNQQIRLRPEAVATDVAAFETAVRAGDAPQAMALYRRGPLLSAFYGTWIAPEQERLEARYAEMAGQKPAGARTEPAEAIGTPVSLFPEPTVAPPRPAAVPLYLTRFFGRDSERRSLREWQTDPTARLITLTGMGGIGKTRLATETVRADPTLRAFVPLADTGSGAQIVAGLRQALRLPAASADPLEAVAEELRRSPRATVVLDNVEQVAPAAALVVTELLARAPGLYLIVTSRRRLDIPGEREVPLTPLTLPTSLDLDEVAAAPSVQLFLDRARSVRSDYPLTARTAADVGELCRLLDGIPLGLELAAARAGTLTAGQIHARLAERMVDDLAAQPTSRHPPVERHRSMNAVIEWSYALLPADLRRFFLSLSLFRGGWDLAAAEAVTGDPDALDHLSRLRGHSLVIADGARFRLLETIRAWAGDHVDASERQTLQARHAAYFGKLADAAAAQFGTAADVGAMDRVQADAANLRAAFAHEITPEGDIDGALRLALALYYYGRARGSISETLETMDAALRAAEGHESADPTLHARALLSAGELTLVTRSAAAARSFLHAALPAARRSGDAALTARALRSLADNFLLGEDFAQAEPLFQEALELHRTVGNERGAAGTLNSLALLAMRHRRDYDEAARLIHESSEFYRRAGDLRAVSYSIFNLGEIAFEQNRVADAERYFAESLSLSEQIRDEWQRACGLFALARAAATLGHEDDFQTRMREALPLALRVGDLQLQADALRFVADSIVGDPRRAVALLAASHRIAAEAGEAEEGTAPTHHDGLSERAFRAAWERGAALTTEAAIALAFGDAA